MQRYQGHPCAVARDEVDILTPEEAQTIFHDLCKQYNLQGWHLRIKHYNRALGKCHYRRKRISLAKYHVNDSPRELVVNTIKHEIAHALCPGQHHNDVWRKMFLSMGGDGERCGNSLHVRVMPRWFVGCYEKKCFSDEAAYKLGNRVLCKTCHGSLLYERIVQRADGSQTFSGEKWVVGRFQRYRLDKPRQMRFERPMMVIQNGE